MPLHPLPAFLGALCVLAVPSWGQTDSLLRGPTSPAFYWGVPLLQVAGTNGLIAANNKWVSRAEYGQITFGSMARNLRGPMVWDEDNFVVNQIGHPYQGGMYYSSARHLKHSYRAGVAYAAFGSLQWEYLMETERPAFNDLITTSLGGAMLGEITYRLSEEILDNGAHGAERFFRETFATLVNPIHGLNRMLDGSAFRIAGSGKHRQRPRLLFRVATGGILSFRTQGDEGSSGGVQKVPKATTEFLFWYGDERTAKRPFDFFLINLGINVPSEPIASVYARGMLASHRLFGSSKDYGILTLGQNFDYINSGIYKVGASGIGGGYSHRFYWGDEWYHLFQVMVGGITLGGASTEYFQAGERDYNLGPGAFSTTRIVIGLRERNHIALNIDRYLIYTLSGASGHEHIGIGMLEYSNAFWKSLGTILSYTFYDRTATYKNRPDRTRLNQEVRFALNYGFH